MRGFFVTRRGLSALSAPSARSALSALSTLLLIAILATPGLAARGGSPAPFGAPSAAAALETPFGRRCIAGLGATPDFHAGPLAQTRKPGRRAAVAPPAPPRKEAAELTCPTPLGIGVKTTLAFCDVMSGRDPAGGILIKLPPHRGPVTLTFDLHNRHTYSEEQVKANRAYARYTATIGVLTMDNTLISRAAVQNEFRKAADLVDRVGGGAGPGGVKAVAPTGDEPVTVTIPEDEDQVSILGEKVTVERLDGTATYSSPGRPIAVISNVMIEYRPGSPPKPAGRK